MQNWQIAQSAGAFTATSATTRALAYPAAVTAGNRLIAVCIWVGSSTATCAVTDTQVNTWTGIAGTLATTSGATLARAQIFHTAAGSTGANTVTMTTSVSTSERIIYVTEYTGLSGTLGAAPLAANGNAVNPTANITIDDAESLLIAGLFSAGTGTAGTGWADLTAQDGNDAQYRLPAGQGVQPVSFTAAANIYAISAAEFKVASTTPPDSAVDLGGYGPVGMS